MGHSAFDGSGGMGGNPFEGGTNPFGGGFHYSTGGGDINLEEIIGNLFRGGARASSSQSGNRGGQDIRVDVSVSYEEAMNGTEVSLGVPRETVCHACRGTGGRNGSRPRTCSRCKGSGHIKVSQSFFSFAQPCPKCHGAGSVIDDPCPECRGSGTIRIRTDIKVKIPAGVDDGTQLRVPGSGDAGHNGAATGDLYVFIHLKPSNNFARKGTDLYTSASITFSQAALGVSEYEVQTLDGSVKLKIPSGTQNGTTFRFSEKGFPLLGKKYSRGNLYVKINVSVPKGMNDIQKKALFDYAKTMGEIPKDEQFSSGGLFRKIFRK
jgi:molecular chaperone DnaJ